MSRIRTELLLDSVTYEFREGEQLESLVDGFEFTEAITVLACAHGQVSYVAMAKGYVGGLYSDIETAPYKALFNPGTNSGQLWSLVRLSRRIDKALKSTYIQPSGTARGIIVHGNRFTLHCILRRLVTKSSLADSDTVSDKAVLAASKSVFEEVEDIISREYPEAYAAPLFKNVGKCTRIRELLEVPPSSPASKGKVRRARK